MLGLLLTVVAAAASVQDWDGGMRGLVFIAPPLLPARAPLSRQGRRLHDQLEMTRLDEQFRVQSLLGVDHLARFAAAGDDTDTRTHGHTDDLIHGGRD
jgi:hypothetical protein